jgi:small subunit ribosomal protein S2
MYLPVQPPEEWLPTIRQAVRGGQFYVNNRWIGGTLTNFVTIKKSLEKLSNIETMEKVWIGQKKIKKEIRRSQTAF